METSGNVPEPIFGPEPMRYGPWSYVGSRWHEPSEWWRDESPQKVTKPRRPGGISSVLSEWWHEDGIGLELITSRETGSLLVTNQTMISPLGARRRHWEELALYVDHMAAWGHADAFGLPDEERRVMVDSRYTRLTDEFLTRVSDVYRMGGTQGRKLVADHYGIPPSTADKWLAKARRAGILGPAPRRGRAGSIERTQP